MTTEARNLDDALVARAGRGDPSAIRAIVDGKLPRILSLAYRLLGDGDEAEDVAQETFVRAWKIAPRWISGRAKFDTWLHTVALNLCRDRLRKRSRLTREVPDLPDEEAPAPDRNLHARDVGFRVEAAIAALPDRQREAIVLSHYQELGNPEAAALMGVSVEALESLLSRGRRALRLALADIAAANRA